MRSYRSSKKHPRPDHAAVESGLLRLVPDLMLVCDAAGAVTYQSPSAATNWGYAHGAMLGLPVQGLVHPDDRPAWLGAWRDRAAGGPPATVRLRDGAGAWRSVQAACSDLPPVGTAVTLREAADNALYDPVTGLPALLLTRDRLRHALVRAGRRPEVVGLLIVELAGNDPLSDPPGEALLVMAAGRIRGAVRNQDTVGRLAGGRFAVVLEQLAADEDAGRVARAVASQFRRPFSAYGRDIALAASIGAATGGGNGPREDRLWHDAGIALERAKSEGPGQCVLHRRGPGDAGSGTAEAADSLRAAVANKELRVLYQPVVALPSGRVTEIEATASWRAGTGPAGLAVPAGQWVLEQSLLQLAEWRRRWPSGPSLTLCARVAPDQLERPFAVADVMQALLEAGLPASCLRLAVTQAAVAAEGPAAARALRELQDLGVRISVADFDPGQASPADLRRLPLHGLKTARLCVQGQAGGPDALATIRQAVTIARSLLLEVTADGLDTPEQAALAEACGAAGGQGDHFAAAAEAGAMTAWLDAAIGRLPAPDAAGAGT